MLSISSENKGSPGALGAATDGLKATSNSYEDSGARLVSGSLASLLVGLFVVVHLLR